MYSVRCRGFSVVLVLALVTTLVSAQITFSRDWTGGKRSSPPLAIDCQQFTRLCRHFVDEQIAYLMHELKQAMSSEMAGKRRREDDKMPPVYDDDN